MKGIAKFDTAAIRRIWKACEYEIDDLHPELKGDARMEAIAERAEEVVRRTQPTFDQKDRSEIGRSKSVFSRLWTKYSSQRNKNMIMIKRALMRMSAADVTNLRFVMDSGNIESGLFALYGINRS